MINHVLPDLSHSQEKRKRERERTCPLYITFVCMFMIV